MRLANIYHADELTKWECQAEIGGQWVAARPLGLSGLNLISRIKLSWQVFIGKYDVVKWHQQ